MRYYNRTKSYTIAFGYEIISLQVSGVLTIIIIHFAWIFWLKIGEWWIDVNTKMNNCGLQGWKHFGKPCMNVKPPCIKFCPSTTRQTGKEDQISLFNKYFWIDVPNSTEFVMSVIRLYTQCPNLNLSSQMTDTWKETFTDDNLDGIIIIQCLGWETSN